MNKKSTAYVSTSRHHEKDSALTALRAKVEQRTLEGAPTLGTGIEVNAAGQSITGGTTLFSEAPTYYTTDGVVLFDNEGIRWGEIVSEIPVGDSSTKTDIQINAVLDRMDDSTFQLPTRAQYLMDIWFDDLKAEPSFNYIFLSPSTVSTVSPQPAEVIVTAFYLNRLETI